MRRAKLSLFVLALIPILLFSASARAQENGPSVPQAPAAMLSTAFTYQGRLSNGGSPANGAYDFQFRLFDALSGGTQVGTTVTRSNVNVSQGVFTVSLDFGNLFDGQALWLQIAVRPAGSGTYTTLSPRQPLTAAPYALGLLPGSKMLGDVSTGFEVINFGDTGMYVSANKTAIRGYAMSAGVQGSASDTGTGVVGNGGHTGVLGTAVLDWGIGVMGMASGANASGIYGYASSASGYAGYFAKDAGIRGVTLYAQGAGIARDEATLRVDNTRTDGGMAAYLTNNSNFHTAHLYNAGYGGHVLYLQNAHTGWPGTGGEFITAVDQAENKLFKVTESGSVYADGSYNCGLSSGCFNTGAGADLAERIEASERLEAGDVVEIDATAPGSFRLCSTPNSTRVAGVISTSPAITMNNDDLSDLNSDGRSDTRPLLALVGQVPVKVSAESGAIQPGDLLACSSTPGHAMLAGDNPPAGTVVGKALEPLDEGTGVIVMLVTLQ